MPVSGFAGRPITHFADPNRVRPEQLLELERSAGPALYTSSHYLRSEGLRLLALGGFKAAVAPGASREIAKQTEAWMTALGAPLERAAA